MFTILHTESSKGWGGQEIRILQESLGMIRRGHRVIIGTSKKGQLYHKAMDAGIKVFDCEFQKWNPLSFVKIYSIIRTEKVDILNTHSSSDSWVSTLAVRTTIGRPKIIRTRHLSTPISKSFLSRIIYDLMPDVLITTGEEIRQRMIKDNGFNGNRIFSIPTGVDLERFNPEKVKPALKSVGFSIGMIGVLRSWKGHRYLIEAVPEIIKFIPDVLVYIVGDGPQYRNIAELIDRLSLKDKVFMLGHREDIPEILASVNVVVHPSYANEGVPQSVLQALAMKRPVIASDVGAIKEVVINGVTGFLIQPFNIQDIITKVVTIYRNQKLAREFGENGRRLVERSYSLDRMLDRIEELYSRLYS